MTAKQIRLKVASPCKARWDDMRGDDAVRFCGSCNKNVYSLSNMSTAAVEELLTGAGETPCVRFFQRADGTVMTSDCSIGAARVRRKRAVLAVGAGVLSAVGVALAPASPSTSCAVEGTTGAAAPPAVVAPPAAVDELPAATLGAPAYVEVRGEPAYVEIKGGPAAVEVEEGAEKEPIMGKMAAPELEAE